MLPLAKPGTSAMGRFCWCDLAATNAGTARQFYADIFGWTSHKQKANGGDFVRLQHNGRDVGSVYQLSPSLCNRGVPSHWLPYVRVDDIDAATRRALAIGGHIVVRPFTVDGVASIAIILDTVGAQVGLWQPLEGGIG